MRYLIIVGLALGNLGAEACDAKCAGFPLRSHVEATVEVSSCVAVTLGGSDSKIYGIGRMYPEHGSLSGSLLGVEVKKSHLVRDDPNSGSGVDAHQWKRGEQKTVFVAAPIRNVCPKSLPSTMTVSFREQCCDVVPTNGNCLVPGSVYVVEVVNGSR
jgi:hypothetical protein